MERDNMDLVSVNVKDFTQAVREALEEEDMTPILGLGKSGIGKTESIAGLSKQLGIGYKEIRLLNHTETDLIGVPYTEQVGDKRITKFASNSLLPVAEIDGERGILVLDEITSAPINMRTIAYQLLDTSRGIGEYKLPPNWLVVVLGNGEYDGGNYQGVEGALLTRCRCFRVEPELKSWKVWALDHNVNPAVTAFVSSRVDMLHKFNPDADVCVFPSPRTWTLLSKKLNKREELNGGKALDDASVLIYAGSCIGRTAASEFTAFYKFSGSVLEAEKVLSGEVKGNEKLDEQVLYIMCESIVTLLNSTLKAGAISASDFNDSVYNSVGNLVRWIIQVSKSYSLDIAANFITELREYVPDFLTIVQNAKFDDVCPEFVEFCKIQNKAFKY